MDMLSVLPYITDNQTLTVKKSNNLIRAKYNLSLIETRIILIGISYINDKTNKTVQIPVSVYKNLLGVQYFNYQHLVDVLQKLRERSIVTAKINTTTGELDEGVISGWVDSVRYKDGVIQLRFNDDIWEDLVELKEKYSEYQLTSILSLKSKYSIRMYEILKSYAWIGNYTVKIDELREILILGNKYSRYNDLDKFIVYPAIEEINNSESLDIRVSYIPIKFGRKYNSIKFIINKAINNEYDSICPPEVSMAKSMSEIELFISIKTLLISKYKIIFNYFDKAWNDCNLYSRNALESTYLGLLSDDWKDHPITNYKAFFAEHMKRLSKEIV